MSTDRWTCPDCRGTTVRPAGITDDQWRTDLELVRDLHAARHTAQLRDQLAKATR